MESRSLKKNIIVVTGPESTGKTVLTSQLADHYHCSWVPEFSRTYVEQLNRPYTFNDVEKIANKQIDQFYEAFAKNDRIFFDTGLIITKVWFDVVYNKCPGWFLQELDKLPRLFYLLCNTELPWVADNVRENGGEMREKLFTIYQNELTRFGFTYGIVSGTGLQRKLNAIELIETNRFID